MTPKIATCCYCGTRAALVLRGRERHELSCSNCGAPLHEMKMLRTDGEGDRELVRPSRLRGARSDAPAAQDRKKRKKKKTRSLSQRLMEEMFDAAEDLFDIFD